MTGFLLIALGCLFLVLFAGDVRYRRISERAKRRALHPPGTGTDGRPLHWLSAREARKVVGVFGMSRDGD